MGEKLLTTSNPQADADRTLLDKLGMKLMPQLSDAAVQGV